MGGLQRVTYAIQLANACDGTKHPAKAMKCTKAQIEAFERIAIGQDTSLNPKVVAVLVEKGLVSQLPGRFVGRDVFGPIVIPQYEVPVGVHWAWCNWCSKQPEVIAEAERD